MGSWANSARQRKKPGLHFLFFVPRAMLKHYLHFSRRILISCKGVNYYLRFLKEQSPNLNRIRVHIEANRFVIFPGPQSETQMLTADALLEVLCLLSLSYVLSSPHFK